MDSRTISIFVFILSKSGGRILKASSLADLHGIFYILYKNNPELMEGFYFRKITNPYSVVLQELLQMAQLSAILTPVHYGVNFLGYSVDVSRLKSIFPKNIKKIPKKLKGLKELEKIFVKNRKFFKKAVQRDGLYICKKRNKMIHFKHKDNKNQSIERKIYCNSGVI